MIESTVFTVNVRSNKSRVTEFFRGVAGVSDPFIVAPGMDKTLSSGDLIQISLSGVNDGWFEVARHCPPVIHLRSTDHGVTPQAVGFSKGQLFSEDPLVVAVSVSVIGGSPATGHNADDIAKELVPVFVDSGEYVVEFPGDLKLSEACHDSISFADSKGVERLRLEADGQFFVNGDKIATDKEVYEAVLAAFLQ